MAFSIRSRQDSGLSSAHRLAGLFCALRSALCALLLVACSGPAAHEQPLAAGPEQAVVVYAAHDLGATKTVLARFSNETRIAVKLTEGTAHELLERLRNESRQPAADILLAVDAGVLELAAQEGLLQPVASELLESSIPAELRDPEQRWFGLTQRLRGIVYHPQRVEPEQIASYEALAAPEWQGRLCLQTAAQDPTIALAGSLIAAHGPERAAEIVRGWAANASHYYASDAEIVRSIAAGDCDAGIVNQAALGRLLASDPTFAVKIVWPNQNDRGVHRNIAGMGITATAPNRANALRLIEWLSAAGQSSDRYGLPGANYEYPVNPLAPPNPLIEDFGRFRIDQLPLTEYTQLRAAAGRLLAEAGYR